MFSRFNQDGNDSTGSDNNANSGLNSRAASFLKMALTSAQQFANGANNNNNTDNVSGDGNGGSASLSRQASIKRVTDELEANDKVLHTKTPDAENMTQPEDEVEESRTPTPIPTAVTKDSGNNEVVDQRNIISGIDISKLTPELKAKMRKFGKYEQKYPILLDAYKTEKQKTALLDKFERLLQEHTPCSSIAESAILFQYMEDLKQKNDLTNQELKRVVKELNTGKENLKKLQEDNGKFQTIIKNLQTNQSNLETNLKSKEAEILQLDQKYKENISQLDSNLVEKNELGSKLAEAEKLISEKDLEILKLQNNNETQVSSTELETKLATSQRKISELESKLQEGSTLIENLENSSTIKDNEIQILRENSTTKDIEIEDLKLSLKSIEAAQSVAQITTTQQQQQQQQSVVAEDEQALSKSAKKRNKKKNKQQQHQQQQQQDTVKDTETILDVNNNLKVQDLEAKLKEKDVLVVENEEKLLQRLEEVSQLKQELSNAKEEIDHLQDSLKLVGNELVEIKNGEQSEKTLHMQHTELITSYEKTVKSLKDNIHQLERSTAELQKTNEILNAEKAALKLENEQLLKVKESLAKLNQTVESLKQMNETLNNEKKILIRQNDDLQKIKDDDLNLKLELNNVRRSVESKDKQNDELLSRIKYLGEEKNNINEKYIEMKVSLETFKNQIKSSNEQSNKLMTENENLKEDIKKINLKLSKVNNENALLIKSRDEYRDKLTDLTNLKSNNFDQVDNLNRVNDELNMRMRELTISFESLQEELNDSRTMLQERTRETSTIRKLLVESEEEKQKIGREYELKLVKKVDEIDKLNYEISKLTKKSKSEVSELNTKLSKLQDELATATGRSEQQQQQQQQQQQSTSVDDGTGASENLMTNKISIMQNQLLKTDLKLKEFEKMNSVLKKLNDEISLKYEKLNKNYKLQQLELKKTKTGSVDLQRRLSSSSSIQTMNTAVDDHMNGNGSGPTITAVGKTGKKKDGSDDDDKISYIKNVLIGFIERKEQRANLLPVMKMVLHLDSRDIDILMSSLK